MTTLPASTKIDPELAQKPAAGRCDLRGFVPENDVFAACIKVGQIDAPARAAIATVLAV